MPSGSQVDYQSLTQLPRGSATRADCQSGKWVKWIKWIRFLNCQIKYLGRYPGTRETREIGWQFRVFNPLNPLPFLKPLALRRFGQWVWFPQKPHLPTLNFEPTSKRQNPKGLPTRGALLVCTLACLFLAGQYQSFTRPLICKRLLLLSCPQNMPHVRSY
jgi:hypothetical protein